MFLLACDIYRKPQSKPSQILSLFDPGYSKITNALKWKLMPVADCCQSTVNFVGLTI